MTATESDRSVEQQLRELTITNDLIRSLTSTRDLPGVLRLVLDRVKMLTQAEGLSFLLYDSERDELVFAVAETLQEDTLVGQHVALDQGAVGWVVDSGCSLLLADPDHDPRLSVAVERTPGLVTRGLIAVPLRRKGEVFGVIEVVNRYDGLSFTADDLHAVELAANAIRDALTPAASVGTSEMRALMARVAAAVPAEGVSLLLLDRSSRDLVFRASRLVQNGLVAGLRLRLDQGIAGWVASERQAVRLDDATTHPRYYRGVATTTHLTPHAMLCVPVLSRGALLGVIQVINKIDGTPFTELDLRMAQSLADHAALAIENVSLYRQAQLASITDDLTGLGNTRHFNQILPEIVSKQSRASLLVLDLDNFKAIVDTHGHLVGSRTIRQIGLLIGRLVRPGDVAARFGGDEFVVILPDTDAQEAAAVAEMLRGAIEATQTLEDSDIDISSVTASVGVATFPDNASTAEELFKVADAAMYRVKRASKNAVGGWGPVSA